MTIQEFVKTFIEKKITNNKINEHAVSDYLHKELEIKTYVSFRIKREVAEMVVSQNTTMENGVKKNDSINQYVAFVIAMVVLHTNLEASADPVEDYDALAESGLLPQIVAEFQESYNECEVVLKMALAMELEDNGVNMLVGKFLNGISHKLDEFGDVLKNRFENIDIKDVFDGNFNNEDLTKLKGFLDKYNK